MERPDWSKSLPASRLQHMQRRCTKSSKIQTCVNLSTRKKITDFLKVSEEQARRKKAEDDARLLEMELLLPAACEDKATTKQKEDQGLPQCPSV